MDGTDARDTGRLALALGAVAVGSAACIATYFTVGGPFGTMNDIGNAATGVLSAGLAWRLRRHVSGGVATIALAAALAGAAVSVVGTSLVVSGTTGWFLAGLVSSAGFAGTGAWLAIINRRDGPAVAWPRRLRRLGILGGALMAVGIAAVPGILLGFDDPETAPTWAWLGFAGWLGIYVVLPVWAVWLGLIETRRARGPLGAAQGGSVEISEARSWTGG